MKGWLRTLLKKKLVWRGPLRISKRDLRLANFSPNSLFLKKIDSLEVKWRQLKTANQELLDDIDIKAKINIDTIVKVVGNDRR